MRIPPIIFRLCILVCCLNGVFTTATFGQFKKVYEPDTTVLKSPSFFTAVKVIETDIAGGEIAVLGTVIGQDSGNVFHESAYLMLTDLHGDPDQFHMYEDSSPFVFTGPRIYGGCYAGNGEFYTALGSNNKQIIMKTNTNGQMIWAKAAVHHEFYSIVCEGGGVTFLGQDESNQGAHDLSLMQLDSSGNGGRGMMYGTQGFENPSRMTKIGGNYLIVGSSYQQVGGFHLMVARADSALEQIWGNLFSAPNKDIYGNDIAVAKDGSGFVVSGRVRGGVDSIFIAKFDNAGIGLWTKFYGITNATESYNSAIVVDPVSGGYLLTCTYRIAQWLRPAIFMTDSLGNVEWAWDYADAGGVNDETLNDIIHCQADGFFYAVGDMVDIDSNQYIHKIIMLQLAADSGSMPCDSMIQVHAANGTMQFAMATLEEPFQSNSNYPMANLIQAQMLQATRCSVVVIISTDMPREGVFQFLNPSAGELSLSVDVPDGGGTLRVVSLSGDVLLETLLQDGMQTQTYRFPNLSNGLYLVTVAGGNWRYPTRRWAVLR